MAFKTLAIDQDERVRWITLDRPDRLNALSSAMLGELVEAIDDAESDMGTHVVVIRGRGRAFSAGYDVQPDESDTSGSPAPQSPQTDLGNLLRVNRQLERVWNCRLPVVAQVHGYCLAGGSDLALHCDMVIAAEDARIGYPPARYLGVPPTNMWLYSVGPQWAKRLLLGGDSISGITAARIGLALEAVPAEELEARVARHAHQMANVGRDFLIGTKLVANQGIEMMGRSVLQNIAAAQDAIGHRSPDADAFLEEVRAKGFQTVMKERNAAFDDDII